MAFLIEAQRRLAQKIAGLPPRAQAVLAGKPLVSPEGYVLDPVAQIMVRMSNAFGHGDWSRLGPHKARLNTDAISGILQPRPQGEVSAHDEVIRVKGPPSRVLRARVYRDTSATGALPVIVYFHGGGFVIGSLRSHDGECREMALRTGAMVIAVDYRLAPENPFPSAVDDGVAAYLWAVENAARLGGDPARMAVAGDSAGGNVAAVVACDLRDHPQKPVFQCLIYPATDFTRGFPSHQYFSEGYFLTRKSIDWFHEQYLPAGIDLKHPRASPLFTDGLAGVAPALVVTAGFDPLRDEGHAYAQAMEKAGTQVVYKCYEGLIHGFINMTAGIPAARVAFDEINAALRAALATA